MSLLARLWPCLRPWTFPVSVMTHHLCTVSASQQRLSGVKWCAKSQKKTTKKTKKHCDNIKINDKMTLMCYPYTVWWHQTELTAKKSVFPSSLNDCMVIWWSIFSARLQTLHPSNDSGTLSVIIKKINCLKLNSFDLNLDWTYGADTKVSLNFAYSLIYPSAPLIVWNEQALGVFDIWAQQTWIDDNLLLALIC